MNYKQLLTMIFACVVMRTKHLFKCTSCLHLRVYVCESQALPLVQFVLFPYCKYENILIKFEVSKSHRQCFP